MPEAITVPTAVAEQAKAALAERARNEGIEGATRRAVVCALELAQSPFVGEETLDLVWAWHAANPHATTPDGRCTRLAGLYGGAEGKRWALEQQAVPTVSWLPEESATLESLLPTSSPPREGAGLAVSGSGTLDAATAALTEDRLVVLSRQAHRARRRLEDRLAAAAAVVMRDALRRAGAKVAQRAARRSNSAKDAVAAANGHWTPAVLAAVGITEQDLLRQAFDSLGERYEAWVVEAAAAQVRAVASALGLPAEEVMERMKGRMGELASASRLRLNKDLTSWAQNLLRDPIPTFGDVGEVPVDATLPRSILQPALSIADGRRVSLDGSPSGDGLLIESWLTYDQNAPIEVLTWRHGGSTRPFEPHLQLDGQQTYWADYESTFAADVGSFPRGERYWFVGDHAGCSCSEDFSYVPAPQVGA